MNNHNDLSKLSKSLKALISNPELNYQILDLLPTPMEIFMPDGTLIFVNQSFRDMNSITDANLVIGKYNLKNDPTLTAMLGQDAINKAFRGESFLFHDFSAPIQDLVNRKIIKRKPYQTATMDVFILPIWDGDVFVCTLMFFIIKNVYKGRADVTKAQEYIDKHWKDDFDMSKIAQSVGFSIRHLRRIFKEELGCSPFGYYKKIKIEKLQEKLLDDSLSIEQVFDACGVNSHKTYLKLFKNKIGMTPSEYRKVRYKKQTV